MVERIDRIESGKHECGVEAGGKSRQQKKSYKSEDKPGVEKVGEAELLVGELIKDGQRDQRQDDREGEGDAAGEKGFTQELPDQLVTAAANDLPDADLFTSFE